MPKDDKKMTKDDKKMTKDVKKAPKGLSQQTSTSITISLVNVEIARSDVRSIRRIGASVS